MSEPEVADDDACQLIETTGDNKEGDDGGLFEKKKRKRTSPVWLEFKEVQLPDGQLKAECTHCSTKLSMMGTTTHFKRHLQSCPKRKANLKGQQNLTFEPTEGGDAAALVAFKYDQAKMRESIATFVLMHEHPFNIVEQEGFNMMMKTASPFFTKFSRATVKNDCQALYEREKRKLKATLKCVNKISLTTDLWKSGQTISYMVLTGHFVDDSWILQKRVLNFIHFPPPHSGYDIARAIFQCLTDWGIEDKVYSISVDNASNNEVAIRTLSQSFERNNKLLLGGKLLHVRCCAHILNLCVQDGLQIIKYFIDDIRESVKFVNGSEARLKTFAEITKQLRLNERKLIIDCPTRWNSTYEMLEAAINLKDVFPRFQEVESSYHSLPLEEDWEKAREICGILKVFNSVTKIMSGSDYPTSNLYLKEVYKVKWLLDSKENDERDYIRVMVRKMKEKFDKYWSDCNMLMAIASVLDPRFKMTFVEFSFPLIYSEEDAQENIKKVHDVLKEMFSLYSKNFEETAMTSSDVEASGALVSINENDNTQSPDMDMYYRFLKSKKATQSSRNELDYYLEENFNTVDMSPRFDVLDWWKSNQLKYHILSKMARDVLAVPISTVASEATFSAGGRVIDPYRASLSPDTVQTLVCGGDWMRKLHGIKKKPRKVSA